MPCSEASLYGPHKGTWTQLKAHPSFLSSKASSEDKTEQNIDKETKKPSPYIKKIKSLAYSSKGSHTGQLDFCGWLTVGSTTG